MPKNKEDYGLHDFSLHDMRIHEVKPTIAKLKLKRKLHPALPHPPTSWFFLMGSGYGKTNLMCNLILRPEYYGDVFEKILYISPTVDQDNSSQPFFHESMEDIVEIRTDADNMDSILEGFVKHTKESFDPRSADKPNPPVSLIIVDDVSGYLKNSNVVTDLVSRNRHYWASLFISNQTLKTVPRPIRSLVKNVVLAKCTNDMERHVILEEYSGRFLGGMQQMIEVWEHATRNRFNYLWINMQNEADVRIYQIGSDGLHEYDGVSSNSSDGTEIETVHENIEPQDKDKSISLQLKEMGDEFTCDTCDKSFKTQRSLMSHQGSRAHKKKAGQLLR